MRLSRGSLAGSGMASTVGAALTTASAAPARTPRTAATAKTAAHSISDARTPLRIHACQRASRSAATGIRPGSISP